jgi:alpha-glucosidase/lysosomal alpha-glucosidase
MHSYKEIQDMGIRYVPLVDVAVGIKYPDDIAFQMGSEMDLFLRSPTTGMRFKGYVWPGNSYFPDYFHPNMSVYWTTMVKHLHD